MKLVRIMNYVFGYVCIVLGLVPLLYTYCEDVASVLVSVYRGDVVSYADGLIGLPLVIFGVLLSRGVKND